jgi:Sap, sulfolipid-1-addressing protein
VGSLLLSLIPTALGIFLSPLAVVAAIAVLLSARARLNSMAFLAGRVIGITVAVVGSYLVLLALNVQERPQQATWLILLHFLLALVLLIGAVYVLFRGRQRVREMAAAKTPADVAEAAPQLPGWLQSVDRFTPARTFAMGLGLFLFNPIDVSCAIAGALTIVLSDAPADVEIIAMVVFIIVASTSIAVPVLILQLRGDAATEALKRLRSWIAGNSHVLKALLLVVIAVLQLTKGFESL